MCRALPTIEGETAATLKLRVVPRAGRTSFAGRRGDAVVVRLAAAPVDGAANDALIAFLAAPANPWLPASAGRSSDGANSKPSRILPAEAGSYPLVAGEKSRDKRIRIEGLTPAELDRRLGAFTDPPARA